MASTILFIILIIISIANCTLLLLLLTRKPKSDTASQLQTLKSDLILQIEIMKNDLAQINQSLRQEMSLNRTEIGDTIKENRTEQANSFTRFETTQKTALTTLTDQLGDTLKKNREEQANSLTRFETTLKATLTALTEQQQNQAEKLNNKLEERLRTLAEQQQNQADRLNKTLEEKLRTLTEDNSKKLELMRQTVDEKLQATVEKRFNESFNLISERLEQVHKGLGEMQNIAIGVGDLKKVLTNVKTRGVLGEIQLSMILEDLLPGEYLIKNAQTKPGSAERVEFAVKMPGHQGDNKPILLPIDSKFPIEDYRRLTDALESTATEDDIRQLNKLFETSIRKNAKDIRDKYINPPLTTDFALMFVPVESLYHEIVKRHDLFYSLINELKILVVGPSNLVVILNSLTLGFKTLAIEKKSVQVWDLLGKIKTDFGSFGDLLEKTKEKLIKTTNELENAEKKSRNIERKLQDVQVVEGVSEVQQLPIIDSPVES